MTHRTDIITFKGKPMTLVGDEILVGRPAPAFKAVANDLTDTGLEAYRGRVVILSVVPSLDTGVCDAQTRRFNEEAGKLGSAAVVLTISMDLPFAQKRWCGAADARNVVTLSDYKDRAFGNAYGLRIKELGLLTRAVIVIDTEGKITHLQIVPEVTDHPDYDAAIAAANAAAAAATT